MNTKSSIQLIQPEWPAPDNVFALSTTRQGGVSQGEFTGLNLALHVEDNAERVQQNRQLLRQLLPLKTEPCWMEQVHGTAVINAGAVSQQPPQADASYSLQPETPCVVMTADCLPVLICNRQGDKVAAAHAGWRGLADGVIEACVETLQEPGENLLVWLGPAIGPSAFEVGDEVRNIFIRDLAACEQAFTANRPGHYLADIYQLAKLRLQRMGIRNVYGGDYCTYSDADLFYSYRRDGKTGRQASMIWFTEKDN